MQQAEIDALRTQQISSKGLMIDGAIRPASGGATLDVLSPPDGQRFTIIADASVTDVDGACHSAREAFESGVWSRRAPAEAKTVLLRLAKMIKAEALKLAVRDIGTEISMAIKAELMSAADRYTRLGATSVRL